MKDVRLLNFRLSGSCFAQTLELTPTDNRGPDVDRVGDLDGAGRLSGAKKVQVNRDVRHNPKTGIDGARFQLVLFGVGPAGETYLRAALRTSDHTRKGVLDPRVTRQRDGRGHPITHAARNVGGRAFVFDDSVAASSGFRRRWRAVCALSGAESAAETSFVKGGRRSPRRGAIWPMPTTPHRSEEHTSELQSLV